MDVPRGLLERAAEALEWLPALLLHGREDRPFTTAEALAAAMTGASAAPTGVPFFAKLPSAGGRGTADTQETMRVPDGAGGQGISGRRVTVERCFSRAGGALLVRVPSPSTSDAATETALSDAAAAVERASRSTSEADGDGDEPYLPPSLLHAARCAAVIALCRDVASRRTVEGRRRVVVVDGVCRLPAHAQVALGRVAEALTGTSLFVMTCRSLARVEQRLRSRALCVATPEPPTHKAAAASLGLPCAKDDDDDDDVDARDASRRLAEADHFDALIRNRCG